MNVVIIQFCGKHHGITIRMSPPTFKNRLVLVPAIHDCSLQLKYFRLARIVSYHATFSSSVWSDKLLAGNASHCSCKVCVKEGS